MAGPSVLMAATTRLVPAERARYRDRARQRRRLVRPVRLRADRPGDHGGRGLGRRAAGSRRCCRCSRCRQRGSCAAIRPALRLRRREASRETTREAIRRAFARPELPIARRRLLRLRLSRRLHRHAPAGRRRRVSAPAVGRCLGAGDRRPVQHRRQSRGRLGGRPLAHEVAAVADLRHARIGGAAVPARAQDRGRRARLRGGDGPDLPLDGAADGGPGRASSSGRRTWARCSAS